MAVTSVLPPAWIASWAVDGTDVKFPIASLDTAVAAMSSTEAGAATGDIRKIMFALLETLWAKCKAVEAAGTETLPEKMLIYRSSQVDEATNITTKTFQISFKIAPTTSDVAAE